MLADSPSRLYFDGIERHIRFTLFSQETDIGFIIPYPFKVALRGSGAVMQGTALGDDIDKAFRNDNLIGFIFMGELFLYSLIR